MKKITISLTSALLFMTLPVCAITHEVVQIFQPLSLHGTDGAGRAENVEQAIQADVMSRPYVSSGALPEDLVDAIILPHQMPTNSENYEVKEANLLLLCGIGLVGEMEEQKLVAAIDVSKLAIPVDIDLTHRQILNLTIIAIRKTMRAYFNEEGEDKLLCEVRIEGVNEKTKSLEELATKFIAGE